eukprot:TRINITY_DN14436_c0_g1_i2.p1 TRINITY_DN14436_c0_g1~~TRINITY_DN14436_c0_g1_i2.p1  ORF type:complete len:563 (-),score=120.29 TRINITY_DN14436_c0_g1_i2:17-1567(-)
MLRSLVGSEMCIRDRFHIMGFHDQAIQEYTVALTLDQSNSFAYFNRAASLYGREQFEQAVADLNTAIEIDPDRFEFYNNRALCYRKLNNFTAASCSYLQATQLQKIRTTAPTVQGYAAYILAPYDDLTPVQGSPLHRSFLRKLKHSVRTRQTRQSSDSETRNDGGPSEDQPQNAAALAALLQPVEQRSPCQIEHLADMLQYSTVFRELPREVLNQVCGSVMGLEGVVAGEKICAQGEPAHSFWVLLTGMATQSVRSGEGARRASESVLLPGDVFGKEYALRWPVEYGATVVATQHSQIIVLRRDDFEGAISTLKQKRVTQYAEFMKQQVDFMADWPIQKVMQVARHLENRIYEDHDQVAKAGELIDGVSIVWSGSIKLSRSFEHHSGQIHQRSIAQLVPGDYLGETVCFRAEPGAGRAVYQDEATALGGCELLFVWTADIVHHFRGFDASSKKIKQSHRYPSDESLRGQLEEQFEWEEFKEKLLQPLYKPAPQTDCSTFFAYRNVRHEPYQVSRCN